MPELNRYLGVIFGTFRMSAPGPNIQEMIFRRVENLPSEFFEWLCEKVVELDKLPQNVSKAIVHDFWPEWRRLNPHKVQFEQRTCPDCSGRFDIPGSGFHAWLPDAEGTYLRMFVPCRCFPNAGNRAKTKAEAMQMGGELIPHNFAGGVDDFDYFMRCKKERPASRFIGSRERRAMNQVGEIDPFGQDMRRFGQLRNSELAEVLR
jgi:hypothetical protein